MNYAKNKVIEETMAPNNYSDQFEFKEQESFYFSPNNRHSKMKLIVKDKAAAFNISKSEDILIKE